MTELSLPVQLAMACFRLEQLKLEADEEQKKLRASLEPVTNAVNEARAAKTLLQQQLLAEMDRGDKRGANVGDTRIGSFIYTEGRTSLVVDDAEAFRAWVETKAPDKIVRQVDPDYARRVLNEATVTGELPDGVGIRVGDPYLTFRAAPDAEDTVANLFLQQAEDGAE